MPEFVVAYENGRWIVSRGRLNMGEFRSAAAALRSAQALAAASRKRGETAWIRLHDKPKPNGSPPEET